ncbi:MAG: VWA domain-containing protein [Oscillospiraceae bacterium]|nr:VWA domain-containing protein [Oscillospiraceae bacterium]
MDNMKRFVSMLLCLVMVLGFLPVSAVAADAAETPLDAAVIFSDLHTSKSDYKESTLKGILNGIKNAGVTPSSVTSAGDAFSVNADSTKYTGYTSTLTGYIRDVFPDVPVNYVWSDHDRYAVQEDGSTLLSNDSGLVYGAGADGQYGTDDDGNYYIFSLSMADLSTNNRYDADFHSDAEVTAAIADFTAAVEELHKDRPLFIASHQPLLDRRNDNGHAYEWATAINAAAEKMDVAYFFGHNHNYDVAQDYYYGKGETMSVCSDSSGNAKNVTLNFTHMCAGYMAPSSTGSTSNTTRQGVAVAITIYDDAINYTTYDANGVYTGSYALNETVVREFAAASVPEETVPETTEPSVPETSEPENENPESGEKLSNSVTIGGQSYEEKTVYVRVDAFEDGEKYLLIGEDGPNNGNPIALVNNNGSDITAAVTVNTGSITVDGVTYSDGYIELDNSNAVFTASGSASNGYTLKNGSHYIGGTAAQTLHSSSNSAVRVTYDDSAARLKTASGNTYYLYYSTYGSETWKWSTSSSSSTSSRAMYIYKEVTAKIPTGPASVTYTMRASNLDVILSESGTTTGQLSYALLGNGVETALPSGGSYKLEVVNDTADIISDISNDGSITFTGNEGTCYVKVSYTWGEYTVYKYASVTARKPFYKLEITSEADGTIISGTQTAKGDVAGTSRDYSAKLLRNGTTESDIDLSKVVWTSSNTAIATVGADGVVTFAGAEGTVQITATYDHGDAILTDTINIYVTEDIYVYPSDGTNDFPEYPHEGAIRFDKTAEAVGSFSETGVAKLELSMTGVPYTTDNRMDVVLMLDRSSSMTDTRINATKAAVKVFIKNIVMNEDGSFNGNRIYVGDFLGGNPEYAGQSQHNFKITNYTTNEEDGYQIVNDIDEYNALIAKVDSTFNRQNSSYGTEYAQSLEYCYDLLNETKADGNKQFCVFMSDGIPNVFQYGESSKYESTKTLAEMFTGTNYNTRSAKYHYEYHSTRMKANGVTVFSVGLGLENTNSAWSGVSATACLNAASLMLNDISGPAGETEPDTGTTLSKKDEYFFSVADANAAADMENVFSSIAQKILEAATNVVVTDKIDDEYTMIFGIPQSQYDDHSASVENALKNEEFYIEFLEYALDANHERTTSTSKLKLYLGVTGNTYYAATAYNSTNGANEFADPVFTAKANSSAKGYWSQVSSAAAGAGELVITVGGTNWKFMEDGSGTHNVTAGAYAYGTIDSVTNMSTDLVIVTPYFAYCAKTRMLAWTVEKLTTVEYALNYFLYLDNSAADVSEDTETPEGPYPTNDWAYITYTNFNGNDCRQEFPIPRLTWNGAQVSYVFYLVNENGEPINKSGQVVDFANATFVTDVYTKHIIWNDPDTPVTGADSEKEGVAHLDANYEAIELLPSDYTLYDSEAYYELVVYEDHEGNVLKNYFKINGSEANGSASSTTKVYNTKAGTKYSAYGTYTKENAKDIDFTNTTVAFAVVWHATLIPDVVVVDYGLDVLIDVVRNDMLANIVTGISDNNNGYGAAMNDGINTAGSKFGAAPLTIAGNTISIENENQIRFHQGDMEFDQKVEFYYESPVSYYEGGSSHSGHLYSSVTVIPATTIYYEDDFVTLKSYRIDGTEIASTWNDPEDNRAVQAQDRPGASLISGSIDADNNYGYDGAYTNMSQFSLGSSAKITVNESTYGTAEFSFYGTGFDVISLTSYQTGNIVVKVTGPDGYKKNYFVDTFYGYARGDLLLNTYTYVDGNWKLTGSEKVENADSVSANQIGAPVFPEDTTKTVTAYEYEWIVVDSNDPNALYQVPVMKIEDLPYGKYDVKITASYVSDYDHADDGSYDFYLDAIRIYDPANDGASDEEIRNAYKADGEYLPEYYELRNWLIDAATFAALGVSEEINGIVFIDGAMSDGTTIGAGPTASVTDYSNYGPNNELYLAPGQAVAFNLDAGQDAPDGYVVDTVQIAYKSVGGTAKVKLWDAASDTVSTADEKIVATATDLYYDITAMNGKTVVILNSGAASSDAILSITNVKVTFKEAADAASEPQAVSNFSMLRSVSTYALTAAANTAETVEETGTITAPFTVTTSGVASAIAAMTAEEPEEPTVPSEPEEPTEPEVFDPMVFKVKLNKNRIKVGQKVKVTVTTSSDVEYVIINGEVVDHCTVAWRGVCIWTLQLVGRQVGPVNVEVICCNADDVASDPVTVHFNVKRK